MNNRSTLIPQKPTTKQVPFSNNKQDLSKARNSMAGTHINYPRSTMITMGKQNDPRPISDNKFKEENITKILDFFIKESYDKNISKKIINLPTTREFYYMVDFIFKKIRPDFTGAVNEENIFNILIQLRYPGNLNKNHLYAIGAPNTSPYLVGVLSWMIELANYLQLMCVNKEKDNQELNLNQSKNQLEDEEKVFNDYVFKAYKASNIDEVREQFRNELLLKTETNMNEKAQIDNMLNDVMNQINILKESSKALKAITTQHQNEINQLQKSKDTLNNKTTDITALQKLVLEKQTQYDQKNSKVNSIKIDLESIEQIIKVQSVSYDEYAKMTESKQGFDLTYEALSKRKEDVNERYNQLKKRIGEQKQKIIQSQVNTNDKNMNIEKYINQCQSDIDFNEIKTEIQRSNAVLIQNVNLLISENKDKDKMILSLQSETLRLEDKIKESKMKITQKENECKAKEAEINNEKNIGDTFADSYNEELTKTNDAIQRAKCDIIDKEKMVDNLNQKEKDLIELYNKSEDESEEYIKELEYEYNDTLTQLEKMKIENIQLIRKNYKALDAVFNQIKNEIEQ